MKNFTVALIVSYLTSYSFLPQSVAASPQLIGECGELTCEELLEQLVQDWPTEIEAYLTQCQGNKNLGFEIFGEAQEKKVGLICWDQEPALSSGEILGAWLGTLSYPGYRSNFASKWSCWGDLACDRAVVKLRSLYAQEIRASEVACAKLNGELSLIFEPEKGGQKAHVQCTFFVSAILVDSDGDGKMDGESKPTGVDLVLASFLLR